MSLEAFGDEPWGAEDELDIERLLGEGYRSADDMTKAAHDVIDERLRQRGVEGWTPEHDDRHTNGEIADAAALYASLQVRHLTGFEVWPWTAEWWKPTDRRRDLVKAGALILAEIERLDRAAARAAALPASEERG